MLLLHLWALHHLEFDNNIVIKKWVEFYNGLIKNLINKNDSAYYYSNRGYLFLLLKNYSAAHNDLNEALKLLKRSTELNPEEKYLFEFCKLSAKQIQQESKGE